MSTRDETEDQRAPMSDDQIDDLFGAGTAAKVREATNPQADQQRSTELIATVNQQLTSKQADRVATLVEDAVMISERLYNFEESASQDDVLMAIDTLRDVAHALHAFAVTHQFERKTPP